MSEDHQVYLKEETQHWAVYGLIYRIVQRATISWIKLFGRKDYNCKLIGDGKIHHWGVNFKNHDPATITIECEEPEEIKNVNLTE